MLRGDVLKEEGLVGLIDNYLRLKEVVKRAKSISSRVRTYDRFVSSIDAILGEVSDLIDDGEGVENSIPGRPAKFIPHDQYSSGHKDSQCWAKLYGKTKEEAVEKQEKYFEEFPPEGYGTRVTFSDWVGDPGGGIYYYIYAVRMHS